MCAVAHRGVRLRAVLPSVDAEEELNVEARRGQPGVEASEGIKHRFNVISLCDAVLGPVLNIVRTQWERENLIEGSM
jgi:hypothetical protein